MIADPMDINLWFWPKRFVGFNSDLEPRLELCTSTKSAQDAGTPKKYLPESFVPCGEWKPVSMPVAAPSSNQPPRPRCGIFQVPGFDQDLWLQILKMEEANPVGFNRAIDRVIAAITSDVCDLFGGGSSMTIQGFHKNEAQDLTVTVNEEKAGLRVGLHIDSWEGGGFDERDQSLTRVCLNLGPGDRYFLYVPIPLRFVLLCLPDELRSDCNSNNLRSLTSEFFRSCPTVPIMRLLVKPGYGYFADTDNIIHDASTLGINMANTIFTIRARFGLLS